jgi:hypothetical protein
MWSEGPDSPATASSVQDRGQRSAHSGWLVSSHSSYGIPLRMSRAPSPSCMRRTLTPKNLSARRKLLRITSARPNATIRRSRLIVDGIPGATIVTRKGERRSSTARSWTTGAALEQLELRYQRPRPSGRASSCAYDALGWPTLHGSNALFERHITLLVGRINMETAVKGKGRVRVDSGRLTR